MTFTYSNQKYNFGDAFVRITYNDGTTIEPLSKHYNDFNRKNIQYASVVSAEGDILYNLPIVNNKLIFRKRSLARGS